MQSEADKQVLASHLGDRTVALLDTAGEVVQELVARSLHLTTVESCTGGALAHYVTCISGSSSVLRDAFVTYSNEAKIALGVPPQIIENHTVYSTETAIAMARAGLQKSVRADIAVGVTGSLSREDPENSNSIPGEVYVAVVFGDKVVAQKLVVPEPHRLEAKMHIVEFALQTIRACIKG